MKRGGPQHPKTHDLAAELGIENVTAVGVLECLFHFTAQYAPRGDVGRMTDTAIARGCQWSGDAAKLVAALRKCRWLDDSEQHRLIVHDWDKHADDTVKKSLERSGERFATGESARSRQTLRNVATGGEKCRDNGEKCRDNGEKCRDQRGEMSRQRGDISPLPMPMPMPMPIPMPSLPVVPPGEGEGDAAHKELVQSRVLSMSYEQDIAARRNAGVDIHDRRLPEWAKKAAAAAAELSHLDQPGAWWRKRLEEYSGRIPKKDGAPQAKECTNARKNRHIPMGPRPVD